MMMRARAHASTLLFVTLALKPTLQVESKLLQIINLNPNQP
jgi:hypothetical protein